MQQGVRRVLAIVIAIAVMVITGGVGHGVDLAGPLDPYEQVFRLKLHGDCPPELGGASAVCGSGARSGLVQTGAVATRSFAQVYGNLDRVMRTTGCSIGSGQVGYPVAAVRCFDDLGADRDHWLSEGLAGSHEYRTADSPGGDSRFLIVSWCYRGTASTTCTSSTETRSRISLVGLTGTGAGRYRHIELTIPRLLNGSYANARLRVHAGGAGVAGRFLYVADTDRVYVFDLGYWFASGGEYTLPALYWFESITRTDAVGNPVSPRIFSSLSIDASTAPPSLVSAQYTADHVAGDGRPDVVRFPMTADGRLVVSSGRVTSTGAYEIDNDSDISRVQGVAVAGGTYLFSTSYARLERTRVSPYERRPIDKCILWGRGGSEAYDGHQAQDLYASASTNTLWGVNEYPAYRSVWAISYRYAFGLDGGVDPATDNDCR